MDFKVGELYYHNTLGICIVTELYPNHLITDSPIHGKRLGSFERIGIEEVPFTLYSTSKIRPVEDSHIIDYLSFRVCSIDLSDKADITFSEDGVLIGQDDNCISLSKEQTLILRSVLNREVA